MNKKWMITLMAVTCLAGMVPGVASAQAPGTIDYSTDGGKTYQRYTPPPRRPGTTHYSTDGGVTWKRYTPPPARPAGSIFYSTDGGMTYQQYNPPPPQPRPPRLGRAHCDIYQYGDKFFCLPAGAKAPDAWRRVGSGDYDVSRINNDYSLKGPGQR